MKTRYDARATGHDFHEGDKVWLWNPKCRKGLSPKLQTNWEGPYTVLKRLNDVVVRIQKSSHSKSKDGETASTSPGSRLVNWRIRWSEHLFPFSMRVNLPEPIVQYNIVPNSSCYCAQRQTQFIELDDTITFPGRN
ncbi:kinectin [Trichonephila clavipes]|nr:kinectin [Trichonephila clavipes]